MLRPLRHSPPLGLRDLTLHFRHDGPPPASVLGLFLSALLPGGSRSPLALKSICNLHVEDFLRPVSSSQSPQSSIHAYVTLP